VIRLSGPEALGIVNGAFRGKDLEKAAGHSLHYGTLRDAQDRILDEVVVSVFKDPHSYTGEDVAEVSCHGSPYIVQQLLQLFTARGARLAQAGEFTLRAFLHGRMDLSQAEAVADLIASHSAASHELALRQMRGGISQEIRKLRQQLIDFASLIELELDFAEEDVEFANRDELRRLVEQIRGVLRSLMDSFELGNAIKNGISTVIAGRPNAGKSTLLNALLQEERAIVSEIAGTTRDTIEEVLNIQGVEFRLIDTAGIRDAQDQIEAMGVEKTLEKIAQSSVLVYVFDVIQTQPDEVQADLARLLRPGLQVLVVANKMDLNPYTRFEDYFSSGSFTRPGNSDGGEPSAVLPAEASAEEGGSREEEEESSSPSHHQLPPTIDRDSWVPVSAINQMNLEFLKDKLYEAAISSPANLESPIVTNARHVAALQKAYEDLDRVLDGMDQGVTSDFIAMDIRASLHHLGEITGEISTEDLLGNIFSNFCIGK
jgi:tRNA modification GTPase